MKIAHLTTIHSRKDTRVYYRECFGLSQAGFEITLFVADGLGNSKEDGFEVIDIGKFPNRRSTFLKGYRSMIRAVRELNPDIVHFHDPELMFAAHRLHQYGYPIVFDIHENVAVQILDKGYIPKILRGALSRIYRWIENFMIQRFHLVIAEHSYEPVYRSKGKSITTVLNLPEIQHFSPYIQDKRKGHELFYIGGVSNDRGLQVTLEALNILKERNVPFFMHFIGKIIDEPPNELVEGIKEKLKFYGRLDSKEGFKISQKCLLGLSVLRPIKNYVGSYPTKIFEYMAVKMSVITSDFPLYRGVVEKYDTGYCVEPTNPVVLADRIQHLINNPEIAAEKAANGLKLVQEQLNWSTEELKLIQLYEYISRAKK